MKYTLDWLIGEYDKDQRIKYLFFWGHRKSKTGEVTASCFSQWWPSAFVVNGVTYSTAEHWMMAQKAALFGDRETLDKILLATSPGEAKTLGREVKHFDETQWSAKRGEIVVQGNLHKFSQHEDLKAFLLSTGDRVLVEASPVDHSWGIGLTADSAKASDPHQWNGLNMLGFVLMEVRELI